MVQISGKTGADTAVLEGTSIFVDSRDGRIANWSTTQSDSLMADVIGEKRMKVLHTGTCVLV